MYAGRPLKLEYQPEYRTWKVVDPSNPNMLWGGYKDVWAARRYAKQVLGSTDVTHTKEI
jgi:hypothetical protein